VHTQHPSNSMQQLASTLAGVRGVSGAGAGRPMGNQCWLKDSEVDPDRTPKSVALGVFDSDDVSYANVEGYFSRVR